MQFDQLKRRGCVVRGRVADRGAQSSSRVWRIGVLETTSMAVLGINSYPKSRKLRRKASRFETFSVPASDCSDMPERASNVG